MLDAGSGEMPRLWRKRWPLQAPGGLDPDFQAAESTLALTSPKPRGDRFMVAPPHVNDEYR